MKPAGADLSRRWLAALMLVPVDERAAVVEAVEKQIVEQYDPANRDGSDEVADEAFVHVHEPPVQKQGHTEQTIRSYAKKKSEEDRASDSSRASRRA